MKQSRSPASGTSAGRTIEQRRHDLVTAERWMVWMAGVGFALLLAGVGVYFLVAGYAWFPYSGRRRSSGASGLFVTGPTATALALVWLTAGIGLHCHYFLGSRPEWRTIGRLGRHLALVTLCAVLVYALGRLIVYGR